MLHAGFLRWIKTTLLICGLVLPAGCATLPNGRGWGQDATLRPGWQRVGKAALDAALEPETWAPVVGALIFQVGRWDRQVSTWAAHRTPIFGSQNNADGASEYLQGASEGICVLTALVTPSGTEAGEWAAAKLKGLSVGLAAVALTEGVTTSLKYGTHRRRPDGSGYNSFPSGHASRTSVCNSLSYRNVTFLSPPDGARLGVRLGLAALTATTAWSRLEAKKHYPSDVLAGMAIGHFLGAFINDAFLGADAPQKISLNLAPSGKEVMVGVQWGF